MIANLILVLVIGVLAAVALWVLRRTSNADIAVFADLYAVPLTESNLEQLRQTLQRSRRFRLAGALAALALGVALFEPPTGWAIFGYVAFGFAGGSLADELTRRRSSGAANAASLERRTVRTYVQPWVVAVLTLSALAVATQVVSALQLAPTGGGWFEGVPNSSPSVFRAVPNVGIIFVSAGIASATLLLGVMLLRRLVQAPTTVEAPDRAAAQHAVRTAAVLSVTGATMMALGVVAVRLGSATTLHDGAEDEWFRWVNNIGYFVGIAAAFIGGNLALRAYPRRSRFRPNPARLSPPVDAS